MCGIAGFLANRQWTKASDLSWLEPAVTALAKADTVPAIDAALDGLARKFDQLMGFALHRAAIANPDIRSRILMAAEIAGQKEALLRQSPDARDEATERTAERLRDYGWQLRCEVADNIDRTLALFPAELAGSPFIANDAQHFVAWGVEQVLENLDRLEVRGRDSAGISIQLLLPPMSPIKLRTWRDRAKAVGARAGDHEGSVTLRESGDGRFIARFIFKTAQLIGALGDNGAVLRQQIRLSAPLWQMAEQAEGLSVIAHTRWASHGAITVPNCHPIGGRFANEASETLEAKADTVCVLNGDVDNYRQLCERHVSSKGLKLPVEVTGDTKIIPVLFRTDADNRPVAETFRDTLRQLDGSMAIALQHPDEPERIYLGQKGSGQSLFVAETVDGLILASENYGLAPRARASIALQHLDKGGLHVVLSVRSGEPCLTACTIDDGDAVALKSDSIEVFARDIFRNGYAYFFEKEVHEAPASVRKTLTGRYQRANRIVRFATEEHGPWTFLRRRVSDPQAIAIRRIWVTGQGTAAIAGMGIAHLLRQALAGSGIHIESAKASELSANLDGVRMDDTLVIAISQSGTTTDTNRTVDLARAAGAWIHAIVNRRNSPLVRKSDSHLFTSDGRDIEMAVASTKAFYSQIAAGKLTALCLADALGTLPPPQIHDEVVALEGLPDRIQEVLDDEALIAALADRTAPRNRYWAVVGNGPNKIAAEEIRIKLSELCYKSIPVDYTEDKKHIDLSTEPLTLVIANDLPSRLAQDTAKEVAIFRAHNGKPVVFAAKGETCFDAYAEAVVRLPNVGAGLDFVLATVAGHLWGFHAARAIDRGSLPFRTLCAEAGTRLGQAKPEGHGDLATMIDVQIDRIAAGELEAALPPRLAAQLAQLANRLRVAPSAADDLLVEAGETLRTCLEETSRPIDTIRHQAKTVTVGISRPGREIGAPLVAGFAALAISMDRLAEHDRQMLMALSPVLQGIKGGLFYQIVGDSGEGVPLLTVRNRSGHALNLPSGYDRPKPAAGSKRRALRLGRTILSGGPHGQENLLLVPVFNEADWTIAGLALMHAELADQSSTQQKMAMLKEMNLYEDLLDAFSEASHATGRTDFTRFIAETNPRDLLFRPALELVRRPILGGVKAA